MKGRMKGQLTFAGILFTLMALILFVAVLPALNETIAGGVAVADSATGILLRLIPFLMVAIILVGIMAFGGTPGG